MNLDFALLAARSQSIAPLVTFIIYTIAVFGIAALSNQLLKSKSFVSEYFLGSRSLGVWAFALTFAATSASGGSFTGFPSKIYSHGWVLGLWIGSYIVVPICAMGLLGKRLNHVARISGAITVPDVLRDRFRSPAFGLIAVLLIVFFMTFNLVAQFKGGSVILMTLLRGVGMFDSLAAGVASMTEGLPVVGGVEAKYLICLITFGVAVIIYTTYGGFHAVVWTDVMQGVVMVIGVIIMLPLAINQAGGLENATKEMREMIPPAVGTAHLKIPPGLKNADGEEVAALESGDWIRVDDSGAEHPTLLRVTKTVAINKESNDPLKVKVLKIRTPGDIKRVLENTTNNYQIYTDIAIATSDLKNYAYPKDPNQKGTYISGPGPSESNEIGFLPLYLAVSFFFMWAISGSGQPSSMVRLMAFKDSTTLRRSIFTVALYYSAIYFPLVVIFCCARVILPGMDQESDQIMPEMALQLTTSVGMAWLAGLLVAAPFAAVMSTVDSFLLMISSALVRDIYQRNINPEAEEATIKKMSYLVTLFVGVAAMLGALNPPRFLQDIIVYTGSGLAACFLAPMVYAIYWPRCNSQGCISGMLAGFGSHLSMYLIGFIKFGAFKPYLLWGVNPIIVGLTVSFIAVPIATLITPPPPADLVRKYFYREKQA